MRKIVDDHRLIYKCCSLYYEERLNQKQIADHLGISKSTVSRMINTGRDLGIVEVKVRHIDQYMYDDLSEQLRKKYHLKDVVIAESSPLDSLEERISKLNERAVDYLDRLLKDGDYVGVSFGSSLRNLANTKHICKQHKCTFIPLVGGISQHGKQLKEEQPNQVAEALAEKFGGKYVSFYSPSVFSNEKLMQEFLKEESVRFIFDYFQKLNIVITGMHMYTSLFETVEKLGYIDPETADRFKENGAVCNLVSRFIDKYGNGEPFDEYNKHIAGISLENYKNVEYKILLTARKGNADAALACINGGYANILITDVDCAKELLELPGTVTK